MLRRSQAFTSENEISKAEKIPNIEEKLLHEIQPYDSLEISWFQHACQNSLCMNTVSVSSHSNLIICIASPCNTPPNPNQSIRALINKQNLLLRAGSLITYNIFSCFNLQAGAALTDGTVLTLARRDACLSTVIQDLIIEHLLGGRRQKQ